MKNFDLNKIGKEMPYQKPDSDFFENFTDELLNKVTAKPRRVFTLRAAIVPFASIAALVAIVLSLNIDSNIDATSSAEYAVNSNIDESLDFFLDNLSDEELKYLAIESLYHDDFYSYLPTLN